MIRPGRKHVTIGKSKPREASYSKTTDFTNAILHRQCCVQGQSSIMKSLRRTMIVSKSNADMPHGWQRTVVVNEITKLPRRGRQERVRVYSRRWLISYIQFCGSINGIGMCKVDLLTSVSAVRQTLQDLFLREAQRSMQTGATNSGFNRSRRGNGERQKKKNCECLAQIKAAPT